MQFRILFYSILGLAITSVSAVGGWSEKPVDDPGVVAAAAFAVRTSTQRENVKYDIIKAEAQVSKQLRVFSSLKLLYEYRL